MKLVSTAQGAPGVDPRARDTQRAASDNSANDNSSPPFDGVLAEVRGDSNKSAQSASTKTADSSASASQSTAAPPADAASGNATMMDQLISLLANGGTTTAAVPDAADAKQNAAGKGSNAGDEEGDGVGSLLKRMAKDDAAGDAQTSSASAGTPTDLMSILMSGAAAPVLPSGAQTGLKAAKAGTAGDNAGGTVSDKLSATEAPETIVSDISVSTHLAPATPLPNKTMAENDGKTAPQLATDGAPQAIAPVTGGGHERGDDASGSFHGGTDPSATAMGATSSLLSTSFGPVRSIATAIGEMAANVAPAATVPADTTKPTVGVARTLTLQMTPPDLGTVGIRLHITGQSLDVQLSFSNAETMGMVNRDRDTLSSALQDQNYQLNSLVIQDGGASASSGGNNAATQGDTPGGNPRPDRHQSASDSGTSNGSRQGQDTDRPTREDRRPSGQSSRPAVADSRGGSLFV